MNDLLRTVCPSATAARYARRVRGGTGEENDLGENISTRGIDLLGLLTGALLHIGAEAIAEVTGLRNPCSQIEAFQKGLPREVFELDAETGDFSFKSGITTVVRQGGEAHPGDAIDERLHVRLRALSHGCSRDRTRAGMAYFRATLSP
ncbi:MOSC domain-containing protein [Streptomyces sp. DT203]|uniref:MOSC domain-containing protein n=1 Tax=Streptomyces sp. DT203 TaxID=3393424 RepID=UPI003CF1E174